MISQHWLSPGIPYNWDMSLEKFGGICGMPKWRETDYGLEVEVEGLPSVHVIAFQEN